MQLRLKSIVLMRNESSNGKMIKLKKMSLNLNLDDFSIEILNVKIYMLNTICLGSIYFPKIKCCRTTT